jgi:hypothetical protein
MKSSTSFTTAAIHTAQPQEETVPQVKVKGDGLWVEEEEEEEEGFDLYSPISEPEEQNSERRTMLAFF